MNKTKTVICLIILAVLFILALVLNIPKTEPSGFNADLNGDGVVSLVDFNDLKTDLINKTDKFESGVFFGGKADIIDAVIVRYAVNCENEKLNLNAEPFSLSAVPEFSDSPYFEVNNNVPYFKISDLTVTSYEYYSELDSLGRCGETGACLGTDLMPNEERGEIGNVKPTGFHLDKYDFVEGRYLFNRCHLIGFQLTGENANVNNLITGTRYMNVYGMLPFENTVAEYLRRTKNHVLYRVTPIFDGDNLLSNGVLMEAYSVEDNGEGICFNVFCYNAQPDIIIDYKTGENRAKDEEVKTVETDEEQTEIERSLFSDEIEGTTYILNSSKHKIHKPECSSVKEIAEHNKLTYIGIIDDLIEDGYSPCKRCNPT